MGESHLQTIEVRRQLANNLFLQQKLPQAIEQIEKAVQHVEGLNNFAFGASLKLDKAEILLELGQGEACWALLKECIAKKAAQRTVIPMKIEGSTPQYQQSQEA